MKSTTIALVVSAPSATALVTSRSEMIPYSSPSQTASTPISHDVIRLAAWASVSVGPIVARSGRYRPAIFMLPPLFWPQCSTDTCHCVMGGWDRQGRFARVVRVARHGRWMDPPDHPAPMPAPGWSSLAPERHFVEAGPLAAPPRPCCHPE